MKAVRTATALFLFLLFFVWSFGGNYNQFMGFYFPTLFIYFLLILIPFAIPGFSEKFFKVISEIEKHSFIIFRFLFSSTLNMFGMISFPACLMFRMK